MDTKTNRSEFVANAWLAEAKPREIPSWQKPAPKRKIVKRSVIAYLKALFK